MIVVKCFFTSGRTSPLIDPHLHADLSVGGMCFCKSRSRCPHAVSAAEWFLRGSARYGQFLRRPDGRRTVTLMPFAPIRMVLPDRLLHGAAERDSSSPAAMRYSLQPAVRSYREPRTSTTLTATGFFTSALQLLAQILDFRAALADHHTGLGAVDKYSSLCAAVRSISILGIPACIELGLQKFSDLVVGNKVVAEVLVAWRTILNPSF